MRDSYKTITMPRRKKLMESSSDSSSSEDFVDESSELSDSGDSDNDSRVFCKCGQPNTVDMIGCDRKDCQHEWLHFKCAGIDPKKVPKGKWFCEDCTKKQEEEDYRIPSGPFVYPDTNNREQKSCTNDAVAFVTKDLYILPTPAEFLKKKGYAVTPTSKSSVITMTDTNANNKNFLTAVEKASTDTTMKQSLNQAEKQHESNLKEACKYVIHNGMSVIDAAKQFRVGRYMLGDCVKDQLKVNLNKACEDVIRGRMTVDKAASVYGVIPGILNDRIKAEKDIVQTMDSEKWPKNLYNKVLEENLQQACVDVMCRRMTITEACKGYNIKPEVLKNKIQAGFVLSTAEENDLVRLSVRMAVLGHTTHIKSTVFAKVKALLDDEEDRGIRRIHWFPGNTPTDMWWQVFCSRHPEFNAISANDSNQSFTVGSNTVPKSPGDQPGDLSSGSNSVHVDLKTSSQQGQPKDNLFYVLPTAVNSTPQFVVVRQDNPHQVSPVHDVVNALPTSSTVKSDGVDDSHGDKMTGNQDSENCVMDPSLKAADFDNNQAVNVAEMEDRNLEVAACEVVQEDILDPSTGEIDQVVVGANEVVQPDTGKEDKNTGALTGAEDNGILNLTVDNSSSVTTSEQPDFAVYNEVLQDGFVLGANEVIPIGEETVEAEGIQTLMTDTPIAPSSQSVDGYTVQTESKPPSSPSIQANVVYTAEYVTQPKQVNYANQIAQSYLANRPEKGDIPRLMVCTNQVRQSGQICYKSEVTQPNLLLSNNPISQKKLLVTSKDGTKHALVMNQSPVASTDTKQQRKLLVVSLAEFQSKKLSQSTKYVLSRTPNAVQTSHVVSTKPTVTPLKMNYTNSSPNICFGKNSKILENYTERKDTRIFKAKHNVDQSMPDALSCLEKTLTKEQKESFMFRLKIKDNCADDLLYNAWKALRSLYHHTDIRSLYDKVSSPTLELPENVDTPIASKLLCLPLMEPYDGKESTKKTKQDSGDRQKISRFLRELHQGRKRRRIVSVLNRREAKKRQWETKRKMFLEPWKYKMERPSRRKNIATSYCEDGFVCDEATDEMSQINHENLAL